MSRAEAIITKQGDVWKSKINGNNRASFVTQTQQQAYEAQRDSFQKSGGGEISICGLNGRIRNKHTIAPMKDPFPPRG